MSDDLFALDIGTRSVIGLVCRPDNENKIKVRSFEIREHEMRSMYDGQIHDIDSVAQVVQDVKTTLEKKTDNKFGSAAIAAAGRSLETEKYYLETSLNPEQRIDPEQVYALELEAVKAAENQLQERMSSRNIHDPNYYCVAHSVINYTLNSHDIINPIGQKGDTLGVEIIATFLPQVVVDGLEGVMNQVGLSISNLTLEPIAAISLAIPEKIRMLNLALVDIGAGTSDIAITDKGSVVAYQMVPLAGDEITDKLCKELLVEFDTGEKIKFFLSQNKKEKLSYYDILGNKQEITKQKLKTIIEPQLERLSKNIGEAILEVNNGAPSAVFCVGGGSELPGLAEKLASKLDLPQEKVAVKGYEKWEKVKNLRKGLKGPQGVTPLGIALSSVQNKNFGFIDVTVNNELVRLFEHGDIKVANALVSVRFPMKDLIPKPGEGLTVWLNGEKIYYPGQEGKTAQIKVNGEPASLETELKTGDEITVEPAQKGPKASVKISQILKQTTNQYFYFNDDQINFPQAIYIDKERIDQKKGLDLYINQDCQIETRVINTVDELMKRLEIDNTKYCLYDSQNNRFLDDTENIKPQQEIIVKQKSLNDSKSDEIVESETTKGENKDKGPEQIQINVNGEELQLPEKDSHIFMDIFNVVDFKTSMKKGDLVMKINGEPAEFTDVIKNGDELMIYWSEEGPKKLPRI
ncbi:cell division protein FtsA [Natranaerobius thermophilus]|uniref:Cell division protein FtsA n=1 Tax=Natranaerobius thermophilus (strain ATCC BAA-1301 / DSM 18059 / JW/NM-WN-LF) TaxID=457570 RepID=B2A314_NATTJ|nr:cell division FtsA domain-containing protein [Natranaerobius thermophilus]ACB83626.1 cell division protein FtsA [Natranaerobius thermophilus JW/NM-WN-LF]